MPKTDISIDFEMTDKNPDNETEATAMFKTIAEAYETLSDPTKRREYDNIGLNPRSGGGGDFRESYAFPGFPQRGGGSFDQFHRNYSEQRAFDLFNNFFAEFDDFHGQMFNQSNRAGGGMNQSPFMGGFMNDPFFGDPFQQHTSMMRGGGFGDFPTTSITSSNSFSSSSFGGSSGRSGKSTSTSSYTDTSGRRVTKTETTVYRSDGTQETTVEERVDEPQGGRNLHITSSGSSDARRTAVARPNRNNTSSSAQYYNNSKY